jgi:arylsulfatase
MSWRTLFDRRPSGPRPNIVLILLDQFRHDARSVHPVFAALGARGCLFSQTITYAPYTLASMHATMTGLYGRQSGVDAYTKSDQFNTGECHTLAQYLQGAGYHTRGYTFSSLLVPPDGFDALSIVPEDKETGILDSHTRELDTAFAQTRPFFCYLHYGEIHHVIVRDVLRKYTPFDPDYFDHRERNREAYLDAARQAGEHTESLLATIDERDLDGETLVIVMTDHGGGVGERVGEKAYGVFTYDYTIRIWMYLACPSLLPSGAEYDVQVRTVDLVPTVIELLGLSPSAKHTPLAGRSLLPIIRGEETEGRPAFTETGGVEGPHPSPDHPNVKSLRSDGWKLIFNATTNGFELYDLALDPDETTNLYTTHPDRAREMWVKMSEYL